MTEVTEVTVMTVLKGVIDVKLAKVQAVLTDSIESNNSHESCNIYDPNT